MQYKNKIAAILAVMALGCLSSVQPGSTQEQTKPDLPAPASPSAGGQTPAGTSIPFHNLADFEHLIPLGMTRDDVVKTLGQPTLILPGRESDEVYNYNYSGADGSTVIAVVVVRDAAVFIRRLYLSSPSGGATRAN